MKSQEHILYKYTPINVKPKDVGARRTGLLRYPAYQAFLKSAKDVICFLLLLQFSHGQERLICEGIMHTLLEHFQELAGHRQKTL